MKKICSLLMVVSVICLLITSCEQKVEKTDPISVIERLSQEVDKSCDTWDKAAWDDAADRLQNALNGLSHPIDTTQLNLISALESLLMNAHAHERQAIKMLQVLKPYEVCTQTFLVGYITKNQEAAINCLHYLRTRFVRFLILQTMTSQDLSPEKFIFVPLQDFSRSWIDKDLYDKYDLSEEEIHFIESTIKPME